MAQPIGSIAIVGVRNATPVALPRDLPPPRFYQCRLVQTDVLLLEPSSQYVKSECLILTPSVTASVLATCPTAQALQGPYASLVYELEMFPFKESQDRQLYRGWVLQRNPANGELTRPQNKFQVMIKKYDKQAADARYNSSASIADQQSQIVDNPLHEFSVLQYLGSHSHQSPHVSNQLVCLTNGAFYFSVMKFCGYDIGSYVFNQQPLGEKRARHLFRQLLRGMEYLQSFGICHRDLSLENIVYDEENSYLSIIDFGMSLVLPLHEDGTPYLICESGQLGKKHYMPPEIFNKEESFDGFRSDSWNLGIILCLFLTRKYVMIFPSRLCPYYRQIQSGNLKPFIESWKLNLSEEALDLLCHLIHPDPEKRYTLQEMRNHPWVIDGDEIPVRREPLPVAFPPPQPSHQANMNDPSSSSSSI